MYAFQVSPVSQVTLTCEKVINYLLRHVYDEKAADGKN